MVDSTQAANTYPLDLIEGDQVQFTVSCASQYYGKNHKVGCFLMKDKGIVQNSTFLTPGSIVSEPYTISQN